MQTVEVLVPGGKASPGPPLGPAIGPLGLNVKQVVDEINKATKDYAGLEVPVKLTVEDDRSFNVEVGIPPVTALVKRELGVEKGSQNPGREPVGNLTLDQIKNIAEIKKEEFLSYDLTGAVKEVLGTCVTIGVTIDGKDPKQIQKEIDDGAVEIA